MIFKNYLDEQKILVDAFDIIDEYFIRRKLMHTSLAKHM